MDLGNPGRDNVKIDDVELLEELEQPCPLPPIHGVAADLCTKLSW